VVVFAAYAKNDAVPGPIPAFSDQELTTSAGDNWPTYNGDAWNQRHSTLNQITTANVKNLKIAWRKKLVIAGLKLKPGAFGLLSEQTPVSYNGVLYMPDVNNRIWAFNAASGERLWLHVPKVVKGYDRATAGISALPNRAVTIGDNKVFFGDGDGTISALNAQTGRVVWKKVMGNWRNAEFFSSPPLYYDGMLIIGQSGGDGGAACQVLGINAKTGKLLWHFNVIPLKPSDPGYSSWPKHKAYAGGGAMWNQPVIDTKTGTVYIGTGNPIPYSGLKRGPGQELFTESILALNAHTGKYRWHYQTTHHDIWDYDVTNPLILFDLKIKGKLRNAVVHAGKNGFTYILDRRTGKPILGAPEKPVEQDKAQSTWATQPYPVGDNFARQCADPKVFKGVKGANGIPMKVGCLYDVYSDKRTTVLYPTALGGANWPPSAYSPQTGYMYICSKDAPFYLQSVKAQDQVLQARGNFGQLEGGPLKGFNVKPDGRIVAMNMRNNRIVWQHQWPGSICYSGMLSTAGNLIFVGRGEGYLEAYNARTGQKVWRSSKLDGGANAAPMTYMANGSQYVSVYAGGNGLLGGSNQSFTNDPGVSLYTFKLPKQ
jgi:quinohemoprotein ethanol dehydrogenase